ncbi:MAG: excinuclease ABC subunit UvrA [Flavobacteriales bacterium]|nr:excinuclease ABC subunit UvrA [Flavobacteriales bacterium]
MSKNPKYNQDNIVVKGAKLHNLKNISLNIPKNKLVVISGVSGSGKSSLAFDTLYAEGQRRYIESLSSYARQFLGKLQKPDVDEIIGISPAIAIEQKVISKNPRSTVGTVTEIYDYLKLLFARIGITYSPISGKVVKRHQISDVVDFISNQNNTSSLLLTKLEDANTEKLNTLLQQGYSRVLSDDKIEKINNLIEKNQKVDSKNTYLIVDRIIYVDRDEDLINRITDSVETAFFEGNGECDLMIGNKKYHFSNKFELDGINFEKNSVHLFAFNNPYGACKKCEGFGITLGIDKNKVIKDKDQSVYGGVVSCWSGIKLVKWKEKFILNAAEYDFPIHKSYKDLSKSEIDLLWNGKGKCKGIFQFFTKLDSEKHKIQSRVISARYRGRTKCDVCGGSRLRKDALYVKINNTSIAEITNMNIKKSIDFFNTIKLNTSEKKIAGRILIEIKNRLSYLDKVGLSYLTLARKSSTLSGGESQRINLATSLGSSLVGSMYILDEPSIGLHSKDTENLIKVLKNLRDIGNTVIIVEHDEKIMEQSDQIIDLGTEAGIHGGELIFQGKLSDIYKEKRSLTTKYLSGELKIEVPEQRRKWKHSVKLEGVNINNILNMNIEIPLECFTLITGVSGSGKSSLIREALKPALEQRFNGYTATKRNYKESHINTNKYSKMEFVDQNPIGKSSRSNPITYIKAYDEIRSLFSNQKLSKSRDYKSGFFSFNVDGGRCDNCKGEGETTVEMQFMADVHLLCDECKGNRFKDEILEVKFSDKNISDILDLTVDEALTFFTKNGEEKINKKIQPLQDVGLGYVKLGQSSSTLSGGEAQRIKLASFLGKGENSEKIIFIFDEPTTGLHFHDINKLLTSFNELIKKGHSVICIEHNLDVIKCADWIIDLGPEGGDKGGNIVFGGTPEDLIKNKISFTAKYLKKKL